MKIILLAVLALVAPVVSAFEVSEINPNRPFDAVLLDDASELEKLHLGALEGAPEMVEFIVTSETPLRLTLWQELTDEPIPFGIIVVRVDQERGSVAEILRTSGQNISWEKNMLPAVGVPMLQTVTDEVMLREGTYRVEVSTAVNNGVYALQFVNELPTKSYFTTLASIFAVNAHFTQGFLAIFRSPYVYYPIGSLLVALGILGTFLYQRRNGHVV